MGDLWRGTPILMDDAGTFHLASGCERAAGELREATVRPGHRVTFCRCLPAGTLQGSVVTKGMTIREVVGTEPRASLGGIHEAAAEDAGKLSVLLSNVDLVLSPDGRLQGSAYVDCTGTGLRLDDGVFARRIRGGEVRLYAGQMPLLTSVFISPLPDQPSSAQEQRPEPPPDDRVRHPGRATRALAVVAPLVLLGAGVAGGIVWSQSRCMRRYVRLCKRWFAGDPDGYVGCIERAYDVCGE